MKNVTKVLALFLALLMCLCLAANAETTLQFGTTVNEQEPNQVCTTDYNPLLSNLSGDDATDIE